MITRDLVIILDPAHGEDVPGKRSPDGAHLEYKWSRRICSLLMNKLSDLGFQVELTNHSKNEIGLSKRKQIANRVIIPHNEARKLLISLHNNAAGDGSKWMNARGFEIWTSKGETMSDKFAQVILERLIKDFPDIPARINKPKPLEMDKEENFTVLMGNYSAVLLEWLFQDNREDVELLQDQITDYRLVSSLVQSILYLDEHLKVL